MSNSQLSFSQRLTTLTDEFRKVIAEDIVNAFKRPYLNALEAMLKVHRVNREESFLYRLLDRPWLLPLSTFLEGIKAFSDQIEGKGIAAASAKLFRKMGVHIKVNLLPQVRSILEKKYPILLAGEHLSRLGFDFFAIATSLGSFWRGGKELRLLALPSVMGICPGLRHWVFNEQTDPNPLPSATI